MIVSSLMAAMISKDVRNQACFILKLPHSLIQSLYHKLRDFVEISFLYFTIHHVVCSQDKEIKWSMVRLNMNYKDKLDKERTKWNEIMHAGVNS